MTNGKTVLITGISGQAGSFLAELYVSKSWEVHGFVRQRTNLDFLSKILDKIELHLQDIRDPHGVWASIHDLKPDVIHHCAAQTFVPYSWVNPLDTFQTNVDATINILQAVKDASPATIVAFCGSSEEYGALSPDEMPIKESTIPKPASPYGVSKYAADLLFQQFHRSYGMWTVITRAFNHDSIRRPDLFVTTTIVKQALEIKHGKRVAYSLGNMDSVRDYTDARDIVQAYYLAANRYECKKGFPGVEFGVPYNVSSGRGYTVKEIVDIVNEIAAIGEPLVEQDPKRMRPSDIPVMIGDSTKFRQATRWKPTRTLREMLTDMFMEFEWKMMDIA